ncbi:hypothetical protein KVR01_001324 [Diaporthe batatas]|uniref:uncharacterized protein n=1 Tax=Diaporthe batatas TaxID=748121 RepID=UPI001D057D97|nr:uncharacterized protein KVR01_001324 [Diaporthe batatas]KAG8168575.1 hypothetical protein KVR01_001324 [Diaporthe batatas]
MALVPPVERDGFSYAGDLLFRETSNLNRHRRATVLELKAHFTGKDTENRPAHWYEAQLLHYGLPPSKVKGTAHKRLFDAVMGKDGLTVPANIKKIEADLKREWNKREREARKVLKESEGRGTKRKTDQVSTKVNVNVTVQVSNTGAVQIETAQPSTKRPRVTKSAAPTAKTATAPTTTAKSNKSPATKPERVKPTPVKLAGKKAIAKTPARQSRLPKSITAQTPGYVGGDASGSYGEAPRPYSEADPGRGAGLRASPRRPIGLLNGRYKVECPYMGGNFPEYEDDFGIIATLDGTKLWLKFDFGPLVGIMQTDRPYEADEDGHGTRLFWRAECTFEQRDINIDTLSRAGLVNKVHFPGGGHVRGMIAYDRHVIEFDAYRIPGQSVTSEISPTQARAEWARRDQQNWD